MMKHNFEKQAGIGLTTLAILILAGSALASTLWRLGRKLYMDLPSKAFRFGEELGSKPFEITKSVDPNLIPLIQGMNLYMLTAEDLKKEIEQKKRFNYLTRIRKELNKLKEELA